MTQIIKDMPLKAYHEESEHYSATGLKHALRSLKEMRYYLDGKLEEKRGKFLDFGNAFETKLLEPDEFKNNVAVFPAEKLKYDIQEMRPELKVVASSKEFKSVKDAFYAENSEKYIIEDYGMEGLKTLEEMEKSCRENPIISKLISQVEKQVSIFWTDEKTGVKLKTRPDTSRSEKNVIVDVKTTRDASPRMFSKQINDLNYWLQACLQIEGCLKSGYMEKIDGYFWLAVEKEAPFNAVLYEFAKEDIERKMIEVRLILDKIAESEKSGIWSGYESEASNNFGILKAKIW
jgi:hypothetical protein